MNFEPNELTLQVAHTARDFARQHIKPYVMEWDESQEFPLQVFKQLGQLGMAFLILNTKR
jgi:alkylation response protein AidB-like acyl-CoA dehydrogenase